MNSERTILLSILSAKTQKPPMSLARRLTLRLILWVLIAASSAVATVKLGSPTTGELVGALGALVLGMGIGVFVTIREAKKRWPVVQRYIEFDRIEARLSELET